MWKGMRKIYQRRIPNEQRQVTSLICFEKLAFDSVSLRTSGIKKDILMIYCMDRGFGKIKKKTNRNNSNLSC